MPNPNNLKNLSIGRELLVIVTGFDLILPSGGLFIILGVPNTIVPGKLALYVHVQMPSDVSIGPESFVTYDDAS